MYPEVSRKAMVFNGSVNHYSETTSLGAFGNVNHQSFSNSLMQQKTRSFSSSLDFTSQLENRTIFPGVSGERINNLWLSGNIQNNQRNFKSDNKFFEHGYYGNIVYNNSSRNLTYLFSGFEYVVKKGKGRIEYISDVFMASNIADELYEQAILGEPMSQENLFQFANEIAAMQNARIFDNRRYRVEVTKHLSKWLTERNLIKENSGIELATTVADNWMFGLVNNRTNGKRHAFSFTPRLNYDQIFNENEQKNYSFGGDLAFEYAKHTPTSRFLQINQVFVSGVNFSYDKFTSSQFDGVSDNLNLYALYRYEMGYNLSSRTIINFNPQLTVLLGDIGDEYNLRPVWSSAIDMSYFINYRTRLSLNGNFAFRLYAVDNSDFVDSRALSSSNLNSFGILGQSSLVIPINYNYINGNFPFGFQDNFLSNFRLSLNHIFY